MAKKVASIIFTVLSFAALAVGIVFMLIEGSTEALFVGAIAFIVLGIIAHLLIAKYRASTGKGTALYVITFLPYIVLFVVLGVVYILLKIIEFFWNIGFNDNVNLTGAIYNLMFGKGKASASGGNGKNAQYVVIDHGSERTLTFYDYGHTTGPTAAENRDYLRYRDDLGNFWRSYDAQHVSDKSFIKERPGQQSYEL